MSTDIHISSLLRISSGNSVLEQQAADYIDNLERALDESQQMNANLHIQLQEERLESQRTLATTQLEVTKLREALERISSRLQMNIDAGDRPDQWSMEDLVRKAAKALSTPITKDAPAIDLGALGSQADAWKAVVDVLHRVSPHWTTLAKRGIDSAIMAIEELAAVRNAPAQPVIGKLFARECTAESGAPLLMVMGI